MPFLEVAQDARLHYVLAPPQPGNATLVFINSMGASTETWEADICPRLREVGFGTLTFDYRGQGKSSYGEGSKLTPAEIVDDICLVLDRLAPDRPILVGLSIGGLFAMQAHLAGANCAGIALINTLRKPGVLVEWVAELEIRLIRMGGMQLVHDVLRPVLAGPEKLARIRATHLPETGYMPVEEDHPRLRLAKAALRADWDVPYERIGVPVLVFTGGQDRLFTIPDDVEELCGRIPMCQRVHLPDAGHALHADFPAEFCDGLARLASNRPSMRDQDTGMARPSA